MSMRDTADGINEAAFARAMGAKSAACTKSDHGWCSPLRVLQVREGEPVSMWDNGNKPVHFKAHGSPYASRAVCGAEDVPSERLSTYRFGVSCQRCLRSKALAEREARQ